MTRTKNGPTPKQDKWKDPFYAAARGRGGRYGHVAKKRPSLFDNTPVKKSRGKKAVARKGNGLLNFFRRRKAI